MSTHGVYVSFSVLVDSAVLLLACLAVGLAAFLALAPVVFWWLLVLLLMAAALYGWRLWSMRGEHVYGLWELVEE